MLSDSSPTHKLYACCLMAGVNPSSLTKEWIMTAPEGTVQYDLEIFLQIALNEFQSDNLNT